ncbi:MAG TPA: LuxR C-terminal-related transcriptional regulator [Solirubrobacteraceae bacterium]|nr:LuxR C-terminal-related transcriptional regulator [Solirubrobacteraceae bacterium]
MAPQTSAPAHPGDIWPLIGRDAELRQVDAARTDPRCTGVVISGVPGVGRSRLAREACTAAEQRGELVYWIQGTTSSAAIPLGAFAALIPDDVRSDDPLELIRRSTERLRERAGGSAVCLGVDDAHLLDSASATLVLHLVTAATVFVVATVRRDAPAPDAIDSLWRDAGALRVELAPLSDAEIETLVQRALGGAVEQSVLRRAADSSAGSPLFARELVLGAIEEGRLTVERGMWRLHRRAISPSLATIVTRRMGSLSDEERSALELLALGEPLRLAEAGELAGLDLLEELERRGMIAIEPGREDSVVRLAQPLYGDVLRAGLPMLRARALQLRLAEAVAGRSPLTPEDALQIARWRLAAGSEVPRELLLDASGAAIGSGDYELAARLARTAIDADPGLPAAILLGRALSGTGRDDEAERVLAGVEGQAPGAPEALAYVAQRIHVLYWGLNRVREARALLARAQRWSPERDWTHELDSWRLVLSGFAVESEDHVHGDERGRARDGRPVADEAEMSAIFRAMAVGHVVEAHARAVAIRPRAPLAANLDRYALGLMVLIELEAGQDWAGLAGYLDDVLRDGVRGGDHQAAGLAAFGLAVLAMAQGRYRDAERWVGEADGHFAIQDAFGTAFSLVALQVGIASLTGNPGRARELMAELRARLGDGDPLPTQVGYLARAEGWAARALSRAAGAKAFLTVAAETEQPLLGARLMYEALRSGASATTVAAELERRTARCDARLAAAYAGHARALAQRDGRALEVVSEEFVAIGATAYAMEAAADGARVFVADGRMDSARRAAARARELHPANQGADPPSIDGLDAAATELTPREAQIAALAARGRTNQQIADELVLSVRTVETYVYRAMHKRGVEHRHEL